MAKKTFGGLPPELRAQQPEPPTPMIDPLTGSPLSGGFGAGAGPLGGQPGMPGTSGMPGGRPGMGQPQARMAPIYYDEQGRMRRAGRDVLVDGYGRLAGQQFRCRRCNQTRWVGLGIAKAGNPTCNTCHRRMRLIPIRSTGALPWLAIGRYLEPWLRPVWILLALYGAGGAMHQNGTLPLWPWLAAIPTALVVYAAVRMYLTRQANKRGKLDDPDKDRRLRLAIADRSRLGGVYAFASCIWLGLAAFVGVDPHQFGGKFALTVLVVFWIPPMITWARWIRKRMRDAPPPKPADGDDDVPMDPNEAETRQRWNRVVAQRKGAKFPKPDGTFDVAEREGKLVDTTLEEWKPIVGGCSFVAVGPVGAYTSEKFLSARSAIAAAFKMKATMVTVLPDLDDENRATIMLQRTSPISDTVRWTGPDSIDALTGKVPIIRYADGELGYFEIYRPEWGSPHVGVFGSTGSGKSELLSMLMTVDRWCRIPYDRMVTDGHIDPASVDLDAPPKGFVATFLIDPQQGQSFSPFLDDLAAPVASTLEEALILLEALHREMMRRNHYLARVAKTWDPRRKMFRRGRKWWNPLVDGPILHLVIDEAHFYTPDKPFQAMLTAAARMWRKCGGRITVGSHSPLLTDLGTMALRDMLVGGQAFVFRTANSLTGTTAFNGRLPVDPKLIPPVPGMVYMLNGAAEPKPMLARAMWEPDWYDLVRDLDDQPIGYPAVLPAETLRAFGPDYAAWVAHAADPDAGPYIPGQRTKDTAPEAPARCVDAVHEILSAAGVPVDMDHIAARLQEMGHTYSTRTVRDALKQLRDAGRVVTEGKLHHLAGEAGELAAAAVGGEGVGDVA
jgi:hypothetical protein